MAKNPEGVPRSRAAGAIIEFAFLFGAVVLLRTARLVIAGFIPGDYTAHCAMFWEDKVTRLAWLVLAITVLFPAIGIAGPAEDANAAVDRWSAAYSGNDPETVVRTYWPDAVLLGTVSPVMSEGAEAIRTYFAPLKGSGNKNTVGERRTFVLSDNAVVVAGFYVFARMVDGKPTPAPSRFTMLLTKRGNEWAIAHHHSSPHVQPKQ